jgi:hypothetical protein
MRTSFIHFALTLSAAAFVVGCEDGPNQTYNPAPANAGSVWNTGTADAAVNPTAQQFDAAYPTSSATSICSTDFKRERWAWMLTQPVQPPRFYAGLDMAKDDLWSGLRIEDAENPPADPNSPTGGLCQSQPFGFQGTCPSGFGGCNLNSWGNNSEVQFIWNVATHLVDQMTLNLGYTGTLTTKEYPDHNGEKHSYSIQVGDIIRRGSNGSSPTEPFQIAWTDLGTARTQITDIFNAIMSTFSVKAGVPFDTSACSADADCTAPGTKSICECKHTVDATGKPTAKCDAPGQCGIKNCGTDGNCLIRNDGGVTIFGIRPMVIYVQGTAGVPQPALSTPTLFYNFFSKWEPFSYLPQEVKLDKDGPNSTGTPVGIPKGATTLCKQEIGQTFDDFRKNCVQVHGDSSNPNGVDAVNLNKVTHSLTHDQEHWTANVLGVNQNFTSLRVLNNPDAVVLDSDVPEPGDIAQDWTFDVRARGAVANEWGGDLPGSALVFIEWARLMLEDIAKIQGLPAPKKLGDKACVGYDAAGNPNYKNNPGCSGIEGLIIPSYGGIDFTKDPKRPDLDAGINYDVLFSYASVLKPGDVVGPLCIDPGTMSDCTFDTTLSTWGNALQHVIRVMGNGDINKVPSPLRDRRYYFKWFGVAFVKYLKAYGNYDPVKRLQLPDGTVGGGLGPSDVMNTVIDREALFFDYLAQPGAGGAQTFDKFEYVDRDFLGQGVGGAYNWVPWDFEYGTDLKGGNQRYDNYFRRMDREEVALYSAMLTDKTHTPGQENNVNITNLFGSIMLGGDPTSGTSGVWPSYACAIGQAGDPAKNCGGVNPPLDPTNPSNLPACGAGGTCAAGRNCVSAVTYEAGTITKCAVACDFTAYPKSGCASKSQACVVGGSGNGCFDMMMDENGTAANAKPLLSYFPGAWTRSPFGRGHSPITIPASAKRPQLGVAKISIPNFLNGPYTNSPLPADLAGKCPTGYTANGVWCNAPLNAGTGTLAPTFAALSPWLEVQPGVGFRIPLDGQRDQQVATGQIDYTGVLESYIVDYVPHVDKAKASCVADAKCNPGYTCDPASKNCVTTDDTIDIQAIEGADFLGEAFLCQDPQTGDILHARMYDSALDIIDWLAAHPGGAVNPNQGGTYPSAQSSCQIIIRRTPYDNFIDSITSKTYGVDLNVGGGQGLGRITDVVLFDPALIQAL